MSHIAISRSIGWFLVLLAAIGVFAADSVSAEKLTIDRLYDDPPLSGSRPRGTSISPDGKRVGFLRGSDDDQYQLNLWVYDVNEGDSRLLVDSRQLVPDEVLTDEEKARRERTRMASYHGILHYEWSPDSRKLLFPLGDALYLYDLTADSANAVRTVIDGEYVLDPKVSPKGQFVSFVRDQNLFVIDLQSGEERPLTTDGGGTVHNAESEFVAQEEYGQYTGYWWAPDDSYIAYKQFDDSPVPIRKRFEVYADRTEIVEQRYPATGDSNVTVKLGLVSPHGGDTRWIFLGADPDIYLVRVDWMPDAKSVTYQRQSRDQKRLELVTVDVVSLNQRTLLTEESDAWINLHHDLHCLKTRDAFIWSSERTGFRHLYLYNNDGEFIRALTAGEWPVGKLSAVDETDGTVWFSSNRDDVLGNQIYMTRFDTETLTQPVQITRGDGYHSGTFAEDADDVSLFIEYFSNPSTPPQYSIRAADGSRLAWLEKNALDKDHPYWPYVDNHVTPDFGSITAEDGQTLYYSVLKPPDFDPKRRYPVIVDVYGGPHSQQVRRRWGGMFSQYLVRQGYIIFQIDNRGSSRRGREFENPIYHRLGHIEVRDQLAGVDWLKRQPYVDATRIGVYGWSYGGYMTVMMLAKMSDQFACGIAGAPVTDWRLYDTHYTERYLGTPQNNRDGYDSSGVFGALPGLTSPMLLIHGMADDNVLFTNSTELMSALQNQGTLFDLMTYPGAKHGLSTRALKKHRTRLMFEFFEEHLK
ncbi:MAG: prolyl oligopeptidase family serine peptidase [candidate division Zixibacteria bacterium]|nr:prolyl oligopeptidase family serine peptidase [candidate division Zixibacteria bacterium]